MRFEGFFSLRECVFVVVCCVWIYIFLSFFLRFSLIVSGVLFVFRALNIEVVNFL